MSSQTPSLDRDYRVGLGVATVRREIQRAFLEELKSRGLRRADIARALDVNRSYVTKILQGETGLSLRLIAQLAAIFNRKLVFKLERLNATHGANEKPANFPGGFKGVTASAALTARIEDKAELHASLVSGE